MSEAKKKSAFVLEYENRMKREKAKGLRYKKPLALGLCYRYDCLKASMDILRDQNQSIIKIVKQIEELYEAAIDGNTMFSDGHKIKREWDQLLDALPPETWLA